MRKERYPEVLYETENSIVSGKERQIFMMCLGMKTMKLRIGLLLGRKER